MQLGRSLLRRGLRSVELHTGHTCTAARTLLRKGLRSVELHTLARHWPLTRRVLAKWSRRSDFCPGNTCTAARTLLRRGLRSVELHTGHTCTAARTLLRRGLRSVASEKGLDQWISHAVFDVVVSRARVRGVCVRWNCTRGRLLFENAGSCLEGSCKLMQTRKSSSRSCTVRTLRIKVVFKKANSEI